MFRLYSGGHWRVTGATLNRVQRMIAQGGQIEWGVYSPMMGKRKQAKRKPIQVTRRPDGFFDVVDGNSTANIARRAGWQRIPVHVAVEDTRRKGGPTQFVGRNKSGLR